MSISVDPKIFFLPVYQFYSDWHSILDLISQVHDSVTTYNVTLSSSIASRWGIKSSVGFGTTVSRTPTEFMADIERIHRLMRVYFTTKIVPFINWTLGTMKHLRYGVVLEGGLDALITQARSFGGGLSATTSDVMTLVDEWKKAFPTWDTTRRIDLSEGISENRFLEVINPIRKIQPIILSGRRLIPSTSTEILAILGLPDSDGIMNGLFDTVPAGPLGAGAWGAYTHIGSPVLGYVFDGLTSAGVGDSNTITLVDPANVTEPYLVTIRITFPHYSGLTAASVPGLFTGGGNVNELIDVNASALAAVHPTTGEVLSYGFPTKTDGAVGRVDEVNQAELIFTHDMRMSLKIVFVYNNPGPTTVNTVLYLEVLDATPIEDAGLPPVSGSAELRDYIGERIPFDINAILPSSVIEPELGKIISYVDYMRDRLTGTLFDELIRQVTEARRVTATSLLSGNIDIFNMESWFFKSTAYDSEANLIAGTGPEIVNKSQLRDAYRSFYEIIRILFHFQRWDIRFK